MNPILVVQPALSDINFVRMSPHTKDTINHICHRSDGMEYSVIGNAAYYDLNDGSGELLDLSACDAQAGRARSHMLGLARGVYLVCFVCMVYLVGWVPKQNFMCRHFGIEPVERVELKDETVGHYIEEPMSSQ